MKLWATGRYDLELDEREFWDLTFKSYGALMDRVKANRRMDEAQLASVSAFFANAFVGKDGHRWEPSDFMTMPEPARAIRMTPEQQLDFIRMLNTKLCGSEELLDD